MESPGAVGNGATSSRCWAGKLVSQLERPIHLETREGFDPNKLVVLPKRDPRACSANACGNYAPVPHLSLSAFCENLSSTRYAVFWCRVASTKEDCLVMIGANLSADIGLACGA